MGEGGTEGREFPQINIYMGKTTVMLFTENVDF